jgi:hypothetical protein
MTRPTGAATEGREVRDEGDPGALALTGATGPTMNKEGVAACRGGTKLVSSRVDAKAPTGEAEVAVTMEGAAVMTSAGEGRVYDPRQRPTWFLQ